MKNVLDILQERNYIEQMTHPEEMRKMFLEEKCVPFYIGLASYMQKCGHKPILLMGGGTALIGDPSGKTDMRKMLTQEDIQHNVDSIKKQEENFVSFDGENGAIIVNNADWLLDLKYIEFMREIGSKFTINKMLAAECYKARMEEGLTFFEMGYMLMQSYDFL